jgi:hypothetical protein
VQAGFDQGAAAHRIRVVNLLDPAGDLPGPAGGGAFWTTRWAPATGRRPLEGSRNQPTEKKPRAVEGAGLA